jgi:hypothetical protein
MACKRRPFTSADTLCGGLREARQAQVAALLKWDAERQTVRPKFDAIATLRRPSARLPVARDCCRQGNKGLNHLFPRKEEKIPTTIKDLNKMF